MNMPALKDREEANVPGFWAQLLSFASVAIADALRDPSDRTRRTRDARFYICMSRTYPAPRLP